MIIENNVRKAYAWAYVESLIKGLYGDKHKEVLRVVKGMTQKRGRGLVDKEFLNAVWSRVDIVEHIANSKGRHPYNLIGAIHVAERMSDGWIKHHFHYTDITEGFLVVEDFSFRIVRSSHLSKTDRLTAHLQLFHIFTSVTGRDMLMTILGNLEDYIFSNNDTDFGSVL